MTDAQMLQNLLAVYEAMVVNGCSSRALAGQKDVIAELRRRIALEETI